MTHTAITPFHYGDEQVRTYEEDGQVWFIATDVARILGHRDATDATRGLDEDEKGTKIVRTLRGEQKLTSVSEAGLYTILVRARVEAAKPFRRWITHEVLPSIRKTGSYSLPGAAPAPGAEDRALTRARQLVEIHMLAQGLSPRTTWRPSSASSSPRPAVSTLRSKRALDPCTSRTTCARGALPRTR